MKVYRVTIKTDAYVMADSHENAAKAFALIVNEASASLPPKVADFNVYPYLLPNQDEWVRQKAINYDATGQASLLPV